MFLLYRQTQYCDIKYEISQQSLHKTTSELCTMTRAMQMSAFQLLKSENSNRRTGPDIITATPPLYNTCQKPIKGEIIGKLS